MDFLIYIVIFVGFIFLFKYINGFNKGVAANSADLAKKNLRMKELADILNLKHEDIIDPPSQKVFMQVGDKATGSYQDIPLEIYVYSRSQHTDQPTGGYKYAYETITKKTITFTVNNPDNKKFHVMPKQKNVQAPETGNAKFDDKMILTGDKVLPNDFLSYLGELGWMNLKLEGNKLVFNDTFNDQFAGGGFNGLKMLSVTHPVWGAPAAKPVDVNKVKEFIDKVIEVIKQQNLN